MVRNQLKQVLVLASLLLCTSSFAIWEQKPPGAKFEPEVSNERLAKDQMHQATLPEVKGNVARKPEPVRSGMANQDAQRAVAQVSPSVGDPAAVLVSAANQAKPAKSSGLGNGFIACFGLLLMAVVGWSLRSWADKSIPNPNPKLQKRAKK